MPKEPMKSRVIRVPDQLWSAAKQRADEKGETVSEAVRKFLERYAKPVKSNDETKRVELVGGSLDGQRVRVSTQTDRLVHMETVGTKRTVVVNGDTIDQYDDAFRASYVPLDASDPESVWVYDGPYSE
jgi:hypothetical protein